MNDITILPTMEAFGTGFFVSRQEKTLMDTHRDWFEGNYRALFPEDDSLASGMRLFDNYADIAKIPLHRLASGFMEDAVLSEMPSVSTDEGADALLDWADENQVMIDRAVRRATEYWKIHDWTVLGAGEGQIEAIDPRYYYRVGLPEQKDVLAGHIIGYPYREVVLEEVNTAVALELVPNRIQVTKVYPEGQGATVQVFEYNGHVVGKPLTGVQPSPLTTVCVAGSANSWYKGSKDLAARMLLQYSNIDQDLNRYRNRPMYYPASVGAAVYASLPANQRGDLTAMQAVLRNMLRPAIALDQQDEVPVDDHAGVDVTYPFEMLRFSADLFYMISGLPPSSFGIGIGRGESGAAREQAQTAASARAVAYRRDLSECLPLLCEAAGAGKGLGFNWTTPPFMDRSAHIDELIKQLQAGVISADEARAALGWRGTAEQAGIMSDMEQQIAINKEKPSGDN